MDLSGLDFLWKLITDCGREDIADLAIDYFLQKNYLNVNAKLKKDSITLHQV
jgi:ubiquitin carboxyl-terminal hydrolase 9/24